MHADDANHSAAATKRAIVRVQPVVRRREPEAPQPTVGAGLPGRRAATPATGDLRATLGRVHRALRGRYWLAVVLGLACGSVAAGLTWTRFARPTYRSAGLMRIAYEMPEVANETDRTRPMAMFDTFMQSQRLLITSRRVIEVAVQDPIWRELGRLVPENPDQFFARSLAVNISSRSEFIEIAVTDTDPATAAAAVTSVVNAYQELYKRQDEQMERSRHGILFEERTRLDTLVRQNRQDLDASAEEYGTTNLEAFYQSKLLSYMDFERTLNDLRLAMSGAPPAVGERRPATAPAGRGAGETRPDVQPTLPRPATAGRLSPEDLAVVDPEMRELLARRDLQQDKLQALTEQGLLEANPEVKATRQELKRAQAKVSECLPLAAARVAARGTPRPAGAGEAVHVPTAGRTREELARAEAECVAKQVDVRTKMVLVGRKLREFRQKEAELAGVKEQLARVDLRLGVLEREGKLGGRLTVVSSGYIPLSPERDRRLPMTAGAGAAGLLLPAAALAAAGILHQRRYRYADETADAATPQLLGILPGLDGRPADQLQLVAAGRCVHQMRVALAADAGQESRVYLMTSATAGEGKTSLTLALGLSFAASGSKTLVIDADFVGRHLTRAFGGPARAGFREAAAAGTLRASLRKTADDLYVLGTGQVSAGDASRLPADGVRRLLEQARRHFDVILVDSGPILGSVEASVVAREADASLFVIARGQERSLVTHALDRLRHLGAPVHGVVFNRARQREFDRSAYGSSSRVSSVPAEDPSAVRLEDPDEAVPERLRALADFSPLVRAMLLGRGAGAN